MWTNEDIEWTMTSVESYTLEISKNTYTFCELVDLRLDLKNSQNDVKTTFNRPTN